MIKLKSVPFLCAVGACSMKMTPAEFTKFMNEDIAKRAHIVKISGDKPDP